MGRDQTPIHVESYRSTWCCGEVWDRFSVHGWDRKLELRIVGEHLYGEKQDLGLPSGLLSKREKGQRSQSVSKLEAGCAVGSDPGAGKRQGSVVGRDVAGLSSWTAPPSRGV